MRSIYVLICYQALKKKKTIKNPLKELFWAVFIASAPAALAALAAGKGPGHPDRPGPVEPWRDMTRSACDRDVIHTIDVFFWEKKNCGFDRF